MSQLSSSTSQKTNTKTGRFCVYDRLNDYILLLLLQVDYIECHLVRVGYVFPALWIRNLMSGDFLDGISDWELILNFPVQWEHALCIGKTFSLLLLVLSGMGLIHQSFRNMDVWGRSCSVSPTFETITVWSGTKVYKGNVDFRFWLPDIIVEAYCHLFHTVWHTRGWAGKRWRNQSTVSSTRWTCPTSPTSSRSCCRRTSSVAGNRTTLQLTETFLALS